MDVPVPATEPERPGAPTAAAVAVTPDGATVAGVVSTAGVFVAVAGSPAWRRVATPAVPTSRDVAIAGDHLVWTAADGVFARRLRIDGVPALGAERRVAPPDQGQPRYPLVAARTADAVDVLWTADRIHLMHSVLGEGPSGGRPSGTPSGGRPPGRPSGDRLTALAAAPAEDAAVWLAARTEDGAVAVTRWDPATGRCTGWRPLDPPTPLAVVTIVAGPAVLGFTAAGDPIAAVGAGPWRSVRLPAGVSRPQRAPQAIAAAGGRLLVADGSAIWLATLARSDDVLVLSDARRLPMGEPAR